MPTVIAVDPSVYSSGDHLNNTDQSGQKNQAKTLVANLSARISPVKSSLPTLDHPVSEASSEPLYNIASVHLSYEHNINTGLSGQ